MKIQVRRSLIKSLNRLKKNPDYIELCGLISLILENETKEEDEQEAFMGTIYQRIEKLANTDSPLGLEALCLKGICTNYGIGTKSDFKLGFKCYEEAAAKEFPFALLLLGAAFGIGEEVEKDWKQCFELCSKAAEKGLAQAYTLVGLLYLNGRGVKQDTKKGIEMLERAIKQKDTKAMTELAELYENGVRGKVDEDPKKAFELCSRAADLNDPYAIFCLAEYYFVGIGVSKDENKGLNLLMKADELGEPKATGELYSSYNLGINGVKKNAAMAFHYLQKITSQMQKNIIPFDASKWIRLAEMYTEGRGVAKDLKKALQCYQNIENISPAAQVAIGWMYQKGTVPGKGKDLEKAQEYFRKAADRGDREARAALTKLEKGPDI